MKVLLTFRTPCTHPSAFSFVSFHWPKAPMDDSSKVHFAKPLLPPYVPWSINPTCIIRVRINMDEIFTTIDILQLHIVRLYTTSKEYLAIKLKFCSRLITFSRRRFKLSIFQVGLISASSFVYKVCIYILYYTIITRYAIKKQYMSIDSLLFPLF